MSKASHFKILLAASLTFGLGASVSSQALELEDTFMKKWPKRYQTQEVKGFYHFRGNPSRTYYGVGPFPATKPEVLWRRGPYKAFYKGAYDPAVVKARKAAGSPITVWTGTGWTGQPVLRTMDNGKEEVIVGAYDRAVHFFDAQTGKDTRRQLNVGGIIKGTVSLDPHGDPILYAGPTDGYFRAVNFSGQKPKVFHKEDARKQKGWEYSRAWDANVMVVGDYAFVAGENSFLYVFKVIKNKDASGKLISAKLEKVNAVKGSTPELVKNFAWRKKGKIAPITSIENSPALFKDRIYFANSSGLVQGYDINALINGKGRRDALVFEHWVGDDVDATINIDEEGMLYVAIEDEASTTDAQKKAARENGHLVKLNPYNNKNPIVWAFTIPKSDYNRRKDGFWSTPVINKTHIFAMSHNGQLYTLDRKTGSIVHKKDYGRHNWSSLIMIEDKLLVPICKPGGLVLLDVKNPARPKQVWHYRHPGGGCIESTPLVWKGEIYVGSRDGYFYKIGLPE